MISRVAFAEWLHKLGQRHGQLRVLCFRCLEEFAAVPEEVIDPGLCGFSVEIVQLLDIGLGAGQSQGRMPGSDIW